MNRVPKSVAVVVLDSLGKIARGKLGVCGLTIDLGQENGEFISVHDVQRYRTTRHPPQAAVTVDTRHLYTRASVCHHRAQMTRLRVLHPDDDPDEITPEDLGRLSVAASKLRALVDNPIALIERARELLEGTAEPLF